ncbi:MAG: bifunctional nuclease family protein [Hyperthermus sp.]|nr:MAG: bifunctional nuclease family protein [Hyperthermus sp.]
MPPPKDADVMLEARHVTAMLLPGGAGLPPVPVIVLELEDGREFTLYNVPYDIVRAVNRLQSKESYGFGDRESVFEIVVDMRDSIAGLGRLLEYVVIDEMDYTTSLYTAKARFNLGGIYMTRRMIPSHAVFLALLFSKPIYVSKRLVDQQEAFSRQQYEEEVEEE